MKGNRRSIRLKGFDYSTSGVFFVTVCTQNRVCLLGECTNGELHPNGAGRMVKTAWNDLPVRFPTITLDEVIVMPNHIHGIIIIQSPNRRGESRIRPESESESPGDHEDRPNDRPHGTLPGTLGRIVQAFKSITTVAYIDGVRRHGWPAFPGRLWQRNYYEHIIRDEDDLNRIRQYIINNPVEWEPSTPCVS